MIKKSVDTKRIEQSISTKNIWINRKTGSDIIIIFDICVIHSYSVSQWREKLFLFFNLLSKTTHSIGSFLYIVLLSAFK